MNCYPWSRVPAFPTTCYSNDDYAATLAKAMEGLDADLARQTTINADIKAKFEALGIHLMMTREAANAAYRPTSTRASPSEGSRCRLAEASDELTRSRDSESPPSPV